MNYWKLARKLLVQRWNASSMSSGSRLLQVPEMGRINIPQESSYVTSSIIGSLITTTDYRLSDSEACLYPNERRYRFHRLGGPPSYLRDLLGTPLLNPSYYTFVSSAFCSNSSTTPSIQFWTCPEQIL